MKQIIHSLWTLPMISSWRDIDSNKQLVLNLYLYTISAWYVKKWGGKISLYADSLGVWLLEHAPYDSVFCEFEDIDYLTLPCWAYPKMIAMDKSSIPFTHIDGDVFIKSQRMFDDITDYSFDLITESIIDNTEDDSHFIKWHKEWFEKYTNFSDDFDYYSTCNNGIITLTNETLKNEYIEKYKNYREKIFSNFNNIRTAWEFKVFVPDLVIEQMNLYQISKYGYKTNGLINSYIGNNYGEQKLYNLWKPKYTDEYRHYATRIKNYMSIEYFRNMLKQLDSNLYEKTKQKEEELREYLLE